LVTDGGNAVDVDGAENVQVYASYEWAERAFCKQCGTHLYYRLTQPNQFMLPAGLFKDADFVLEKEIYVDEQPDYYRFANNTEKLTEAEVIAQFSGN